MASAEKKKRRRWDSAVPAEEQEGQAPPQAEQDETQAKKPKLDDHTSADAPPVNGSQSQPAPQKKPSATLAALQKAKKALQMKKEALSKLKGKPDAGGAQSAAGTTAATAPAKPRASRFGPKVTDVAAAAAAAAAANLTAGAAPPTAANVSSLLATNVQLQQALAMANAIGAAGSSGSLDIAKLLAAQQQLPQKEEPKAVRLDAQGRMIDADGNVIEHKVERHSTLKVNINKQKKDSFVLEKPDEGAALDSKFFDPRMQSGAKTAARSKRATFNFVEEGKYIKDAEKQRLKAAFGERQQARALREGRLDAKKGAGLSGDPNLVPLGARRDDESAKRKEAVPDVEWWDRVLVGDAYPEPDDSGSLPLRYAKITLYVEHPVQIEPKCELTEPEPQALKLTKKEQKKLRTQTRTQREKERQEMIRAGLLEPPKPKVKISNLMRVLGNEHNSTAIQDPTLIEKEVRQQMAEREQAHEERNLARKLLPSERRLKKMKKLFGEDKDGQPIHAAIYKVRSLANPRTRFKVDINAQENKLTGCAMLLETWCLVVVEGTPKGLRRYKKLMLNRIDWEAEAEEGLEEDQEVLEDGNWCHCVWEGLLEKRSFKRFSVERPRSEDVGRAFLKDFGVPHYFDVAQNFQPS